ncbi:MAG TPA: intradiol ring-cleavage dioxygenase [Candidatus Sulfotelmatobacter sp.]|nr:intradiol ring-cleavage dioxygenase [Candidatus Sulfotelmatobacter sp.]
MRNLTEANLTDAVVAKLAACPNPRLKQILTAAIRHAHAFVREVELTEAEWAEGIRFLTATGQMCDDKRQEFILLSDVLGVSMLMDAINHRKPAGSTESTVLGPFYIEGAPDLPLGSNIAGTSPGEPTVVSGRVLGSDGTPIAGALLDIWQTAANGLYSSQDPQQDLYNLRGRFRSDAEGRYNFRTIKPVSYPVPTDGPVGDILRAMGRHPYRPAHIHFIVSAPGYEGVATHLFVEGDPYLESDAVFGVKDSLVVDFKPTGPGNSLEVHYDFGLKRAG